MNIADQPSLRDNFVLAGGVMSVVEDGYGPPVLLGHGFLWDWKMWQPQVRQLRSRCRVIVPEMWGHGRSGPLPAGTSSLPDLADQAIELLDRLEIDQCVVVGSSMGGMWGAHLAARAPERVAGLILMNSSLAAEPADARLVYGAMLDLVEATGQVGPDVAAAITTLFFAHDIEDRMPSLPATLRQRLDSFSAKALRGSIVPLGRMIFDRPDALDLIAEINAPTMVIAGGDDRARPSEESRVMAERLQSPLVVISGCGHTATLEHPDAVNAALLHLLDALGWAA